MPLLKKKRTLSIDIPTGYNVEKSMSSPEISTSDFKNESNENISKITDSQRRRKKSWLQRLINPFRKLRRNTTTACFASDNETKFHTPLSKEDMFVILNKEDETDQNGNDDKIPDQTEKEKNSPSERREILRSQPSRISSKRKAPSAPLNVDVVNELKLCLNQKNNCDVSKSPTTTDTPDEHIYSNEAHLGHNMASSRRRTLSNGTDDKRRSSNLENIYEVTWECSTANNKNIDVVQSNIVTNTKTPNNVMLISGDPDLAIYDSVDFSLTPKQEHLESLFSKFAKPKPPKRKPSRRGSKPEEYLRNEIDSAPKNNKNSILHRRSDAELEEVIMKLSEIPAPEIEDIPKVPPTPKKRTKFNSSPNLLNEDKPLYANLNEKLNLKIDDWKPIDKTSPADQLIEELANCVNLKPEALQRRSNSFPRRKSHSFTDNKTLSNSCFDHEPNDDEVSKKGEESNNFERSKTLPNRYYWKNEHSSIKSKTNILKKQLKTETGNNEWVEIENLTEKQDSCTQTSQSSLFSDHTSTADFPLPPNLDQLGNKVKELLNDESMEQTRTQSTPPNTPEQTEMNLNNTLKTEIIKVKADISGNPKDPDLSLDPNDTITKTIETVQSENGDTVVQTTILENKNLGYITSSMESKVNKSSFNQENDASSEHLPNLKPENLKAKSEIISERVNTPVQQFENNFKNNENSTERKVTESIVGGKKEIVTTEVTHAGGSTEVITTETITITGNMDPSDIIHKKFIEAFPNQDFTQFSSLIKEGLKGNSTLVISETNIESEKGDSSQVLYDKPDETFKESNMHTDEKPTKQKFIKRKPDIHTKPALFPKPEEFVRRGGIRRKSDSTSEDPHNQTKSSINNTIKEFNKKSSNTQLNHDEPSIKPKIQPRHIYLSNQ